jgi:hypothetical protein
MYLISYSTVASLLYIIPEHPEAFDPFWHKFKTVHHSRNLDLVFTTTSINWGGLQRQANKKINIF